MWGDDGVRPGRDVQSFDACEQLYGKLFGFIVSCFQCILCMSQAILGDDLHLLWCELADRLLIREGVLDDAESTGEIMGEQSGIVGDDEEEMVVVRDQEWSRAR